MDIIKEKNKQNSYQEDTVRWLLDLLIDIIQLNLLRRHLMGNWKVSYSIIIDKICNYDLKDNYLSMFLAYLIYLVP